MKSKLSMIVVALFVAFMLVNSASAEKDGSQSPQGRSEKINLPCSAEYAYLPPPDVKVIFNMTNNTAAWLAEGKEIHFSGQGTKNQQTVSLVTNQILTLNVMVPPNGSVQLWSKYDNVGFGPPFTCQAWYFK